MDGAGGEFVQFRKASDRQCGLTVADVAGHGRDAAPSRDIVLDVLGDLDEAKRNDRHWLINLNGQLCQALGDDRFCAAVSARLEWSEKNATTVTSVAVAGMPTPVLYRAATGSVKRIGSGALPFGALDEPRFRPEPVCGSGRDPG